MCYFMMSGLIQKIKILMSHNNFFSLLHFCTIFTFIRVERASQKNDDERSGNNKAIWLMYISMMLFYFFVLF